MTEAPARAAWIVAPLTAGVPAAIIFLLWTTRDGGYATTTWMPSALFLGSLLVLLVWFGPGITASRRMLVALGCFSAFTVWSFCSVAWADVRGDAWEGANRTLLYLLVFAAFGLWRWRVRDAAVLLGALSVGIAGAGLVALAAAIAADDPTTSFIGRRLAEPTGYYNATAAILLGALWPAAYLAARSELPVAARALMFGVSPVLLCLAFLSQSRGSVVALAISLIVYLAVVSGRLRALFALIPIGLVTAVAVSQLLQVHESFGTPRFAGELKDALLLVLASGAVAGVVGLVIAFVDNRVQLSAAFVRGLSRAALAAGTLAATIVAAAAFIVGSPTERLDRAWNDFRRDAPRSSTDLNLTSGVGSNRYDFWRVALSEARSSPVVGIGADNFAAPYLRDRQSDEEPLYAHSLELDVLSQTGIVGVALIVAGLAFALGAVVLVRARLSTFGRGLAAAAIASFAYWLAHASVDWFWQFPGVTAPALACLALAGGLWEAPVPDPRGLGVAGRTTFTAVAAVAALSLVFPWLGAVELRRASAVWQQSPATAYGRLERARSLNPLTDRPDHVEGVIAGRLGDWERMRSSFLRSLARNPWSWYAHLEIALAEAQLGRRGAALRQLAQAKELNPREPMIGVVRRRLLSGERVAPAEIDALFRKRTRDRTS